MRAFGYLIAGVALLTSTAAQLVKPPAPNSSLGNGWRYKGCYSDVNLPNVPGDRALGVLQTTGATNRGLTCTNACRAQSYTYAGTVDDQCWCDNVINRNNSATAGGLSPLGDISCGGGCRGNALEACGQANLFITIYEFTARQRHLAQCLLSAGKKHVNELWSVHSRLYWLGLCTAAA
ncbi:hypothetical protein OPT61_g1945 [Boeremia exigua]|uniref:Uncharacterized protein n=1 Tax=Boeremia exigua TaxID=749465 RepID=A0ACC2INA1_9PLEO|nr:hypothetical protein OPT61_g1945 [Boeremia exigua]